MNKKVLIGIGIVVGLVVLIIVIGLLLPDKKKKQKPPPKEITLTYWRPLEEKEVFEPIIEDYEKANPNVKIEYKKLNLKEYEPTLIDALAAGKGPDLMSLHNDWMPRYFDKIEPIAEDKLSVDEYDSTFFDVAKEDNVKDNRIYGIPYSIDTLALFINGEILNRAGVSDPRTWEDIVGKQGDPNKPGMLGKLNNRQGNTFNQSAIALGTSNVSRSVDILALMMLQQETLMTSTANDRAIFNLTQKVEGVTPDPNLGTDALRFYTSFANPTSTNYSWNAAQGDSVKAFADGRVAMMLNYSYQIPVLKRLNPNLNYRIIPAPQIGGRNPVNYGNYWTESVNKSSPNAGAAWDFIRYVSGKKLTNFSNASDTVSSRKDAGPSSSLGKFYEQTASARVWYKGNNAKADEIFISMIEAVLRGDDPQRAIDAAANRQTDVLRRLKGVSQ